MKTLRLLRHAKSGWDDSSLKDFDRPLAKRGRKDADLMGRVLADRSPAPDAVCCSSAVRARETIEILAPLIGFPLERVRFDDSLYLAPAERLLEAVRGVDDAVASVFFCGHNPGMEEAGRFFVPGGFASFPTCGFLEIRFSAETWTEIDRENVEAHFFLSPKRLGANEE